MSGFICTSALIAAVMFYLACMKRYLPFSLLGKIVYTYILLTANMSTHLHLPLVRHFGQYLPSFWFLDESHVYIYTVDGFLKHSFLPMGAVYKAAEC